MSEQHQSERETEAQAAERNSTRPWGSHLRDTRIRQGLSIEEVAETLLLEVSLIEALEEEACDKLPGSSFVMGYLRNYAKLLEVDSEPLVEAYRKVCGNDEPELTQVTRIKEVAPGEAAPRYVAWIVIGVVVISFGIWWWSEVLVPSATDITPVATAPQVESVSPLPSDTPVSPQAPAVSSPDTQPSLPESDIAETPVPSAAVVEAVELDTVRLTLSDDSWVEITDARGERLFMDLARAGETKVLEGKAPFEVLLGNAPAVTIEYNNEPYERTGNRKGVARFTLGE